MPLTAEQVDELIDSLDAPLLMAEGDGGDLARKALEDQDGIEQGREDFEVLISHSAGRDLKLGEYELYDRMAAYEFEVSIPGTETLEEPARTKTVTVIGHEVASLHIESTCADLGSVGVRGFVLWSHQPGVRI